MGQSAVSCKFEEETGIGPRGSSDLRREVEGWRFCVRFNKLKKIS